MATHRPGSLTGALADARLARTGFPWEALLEGIPAAFYVDRPDGTSLWSSKNLESVIGCTNAEWAEGDEAWLARIHPDDRERVVASLERLLEDGVPQSWEYRIVLADGTMRWIYDRGILVTDPETGETLLHGMLVDVTGDRSALEVSERVTGLLQTLMEHSGEAVTIVDAAGVVIYQNATMGRVVGRPPEWFRDRTPLDLMPPEDAARAMHILGELHGRPGAQLPGEFRLRHADGSWRIVEGVATNLLHDPAVRGIVLNYRDVTVQREHQEQHRRLIERVMNAEAEQRTRIAEELHDDTIQVMTASLVQLDRTERHLRAGDTETARLAILDARDALRAATERTRRLTFELRPQLLEAAGLRAAIGDLAEALQRDTGAEVTLRMRDARYPPMIETLAFRTIREALINVRKHARATRVSISVTERGGALHAVVRDDGRGFRTSRRSSLTSTHIGLDTARERILAVGGTFELTSVTGEGTTVRFAIPLAVG
jgi:PAS domain S-box-containing protein